MSFVLSENIQNGNDLDATKIMSNFNKLALESNKRAKKTEIIKILEHETTSTLSVGKSGVPIIIPENFTISEVTGYVVDAPVGDDLIVDIHDDSDVTIFATPVNRPTIADGANKASVTTPDVTGLTKDQLLWIYIDQVGSGTAGSTLKVQIRGVMV